MNWENYLKVNELDEFDSGDKSNLFYLPGTWLHPFYLEALNILFRYENTLRVFVYSILKSRFGKDWANTRISSDLTISSAAKQRKAQHDKFGYLGDKIHSPMMFLNSGELIYILDDDGRWSHFSRHFDADRSVIIHKMNEINAIRNALAHFRPVSEEDVILLKQNIKHVFTGISTYMSQLYSIYNNVPSNLEESWYKGLVDINPTHSHLRFTQSDSGDLVQVGFTFKPPFKCVRRNDTLANLSGSRLLVQNIFKKLPALCKSSIYISDTCWPHRSETFDNPEGCKITHTVNFIFARGELVKNAEEIIGHFEKLAHKIDEEVRFLDDNEMAHGTLLVPASVYAKWDSKASEPHWTIKNSLLNFKTDTNKIVEVEYWGEEQGTLFDPITERSRMPWIHSTISSRDTMMF